MTKKTLTFTFTREQHAQIVAALALAAQQYADPSLIIETMRLVAPAAAEPLRRAVA